MEGSKIKLRLLCISLILILLAVVGTGSYYVGKQSNNNSIDDISPTIAQISPTTKIVACTADAKQCPDGSWVSRIPPNCEFAPCSSTTGATCGGWDISGETICECSGKIIKPTCAPDAFCGSASYICEGQCGKCCYRGIAVDVKYPKCDKIDR